GGAAGAGTFAVELGEAAPVVPVETPDDPPPAAPPADPLAEPPPDDPPPPPLCARAGKDRAARTRVAEASSPGFMAGVLCSAGSTPKAQAGCGPGPWSPGAPPHRDLRPDGDAALMPGRRTTPARQGSPP